MAQPTAAYINKSSWMSEVLGIEKLKLTDIIWPGAHNCGMDKKARDYGPIVGNWTTCQNDSFAFQLAQGVRAFDIRIGYESRAEGERFYFHHNGSRSGRLLDELLEAVLAFISENPGEFLILDFHQLGDGQHSFPYQTFSDLMADRLGPHAIAHSLADLSVGELKRTRTRSRVMLAASGSLDLDRTLFWPRISHKWKDSTFTSPQDLYLHIARSLNKEPVSSTFPWSLSATCYSLLGPADIKHYVDIWFHPSVPWISRCSIINSDFVDESKIVEHCAMATAIKAAAITP